jgi:hypothetical protein
MGSGEYSGESYILSNRPCCAVCAVSCCAAAGALPWKELMREFWGPLEQAMSAAHGVSTSEVRGEEKALSLFCDLGRVS